jgi:hypothetical protein
MDIPVLLGRECNQKVQPYTNLIIILSGITLKGKVLYPDCNLYLCVSMET